MKAIYFGILVLLLVSAVFAPEAQFMPSSIPSSGETEHLGYKFSNNSNIIISTNPDVRCVWKPDSNDDGWKECEAVFEVNNQNQLAVTIANLNVLTVFMDNNIRNLQVTYSNTYNNVNDVYYEESIETTEDQNVRSRIDRYFFTRRNFTNFVPVPLAVDTSIPFAVRVEYDAPKYEDNQFNLSLSAIGFNAFIDPDQTSCGSLGTPNSLYSLTNNVSATATCFTTINTPGVILDCGGNSITYSTEGSGFGVYAIGETNATVRNCILINNNTLSNFSHAIYFTDSNNSYIINNTMHVYGNRSSGIRVAFTNYTNATANTISTYTGILSYGSYYSSAFYNNFSNNSVRTYNTTGYGLYLYTSEHNTAHNNTINTTGLGAAGIYVDTGTNYTYLVLNNITTSGNGSRGISLFRARHSILDSNLIHTLGSSSDGIFLTTNSTNNTLLNNMITANQDREIDDNTNNLDTNYLRYSNMFGEIRWIDDFSGGFLRDLDLEGPIGLGLNLFIGSNTAALNTTAFSSTNINSTANITLLNLSFGAIGAVRKLGTYTTNTTQIINEGTDCTGNGCLIINYTGGSLVFNTTSFSSFAATEVFEVDVFDLSQVYTNSSFSAVFRFFMRNIASYANVFNWGFNTGAGTISSNRSTALTPNETVMVFVERVYSSGGMYTITANGTTLDDEDTQSISASVG